MQRVYGMGGQAMRRGLVTFGDRVLLVAHPDDDHTPQHIVAIDADGQALYLRTDGAFAPVPLNGELLDSPATLRGEGIEADYADGVLALLNADSLSDWTDSGFLDWGSGTTPVGSPREWSTRVPLVWRESHQRTVSVLGTRSGGSLIVGHVGRLFRGAEGRQPVHFPSAMISTDRGRTWTWGPEIEGIRPPAGAYAAAWPAAPGGGAILYFVLTLPGDDQTPPLAVFRLDETAEGGVAMSVLHSSRLELWKEHAFQSSGRTFVPSPIRHWVTRWGMVLETTTQGLFWMESPDAFPKRIASPKQTLEEANRTLYFAARNELMRVMPSGRIERLVDPSAAAWSTVGEIERPEGTHWLQAAGSDVGALWLLGHSGSPQDVNVATWHPGSAH